jgi:hypothetical protein
MRNNCTWTTENKAKNIFFTSTEGWVSYACTALSNNLFFSINNVTSRVPPPPLQIKQLRILQG